MTKIRRLKRGFIGKLTTLTISSPYGNRRGGFHYGVDIVVPVGTKIYAPFAGNLTRKIQKSSLRSYGLYVQFSSGDMTLLFAHLSKETENITEGAKTEGALIAISGGARGAYGSGSSTGAHVHFEVHINNKKQNPQYFISDALKGKITQNIQTIKAVNENGIEEDVSVPMINEAWLNASSEEYDVSDVELLASKQNNANINDSQTTETDGGEVDNKLKDKLVPGIWQIVKMVLDADVANLRVHDASTSVQAGSLISFFQKVCQKPFVEFSGDTFGDQYYFTVRKPPFDKNGMLKTLEVQELLNDKKYNPYVLYENDLLNSRIEFNNQGIYSWYQFIPIFELGSQSELQYIIPAVLFPEYASIWGSRELTIRSMYRNFISTGVRDKTINGEKTENGDYEVRQSIHDLHYIIESNAYNPFVRTGSITLRGNRQLKRGMFVKLVWNVASEGEIGVPLSEIFYIESVSHSYSVNRGGVNRTTTLQLSHGMIEDYIKTEKSKNIPSYFNLIDFGDYDRKKERITMDDWRNIISSWRVNTDVFLYFLKKMQFIAPVTQSIGIDAKRPNIIRK